MCGTFTSKEGGRPCLIAGLVSIWADLSQQIGLATCRTAQEDISAESESSDG